MDMAVFHRQTTGCDPQAIVCWPRYKSSNTLTGCPSVSSIRDRSGHPTLNPHPSVVMANLPSPTNGLTHGFSIHPDSCPNLLCVQAAPGREWGPSKTKSFHLSLTPPQVTNLESPTSGGPLRRGLQGDYARGDSGSWTKWKQTGGGHGEYRGRDDGRGPGKRLVTTAKGLVRVRDG